MTASSTENGSTRHILIVEDDADIANLIARYLQRSGYSTAVVRSGDEVLPYVRRRSPDLVVLDLMLPRVTGLDVCRALRADPDIGVVPIIIVTARGDEADRVAGLELGADDYVTKPFSPNELVARVGAVLRRTGGRQPAGAVQVLRYDSVELDLGRHTVTESGHEVHLTAKEFLLLQLLIERRGRVVSRDQALSEVWHYRYTGGTRTVDVHIRRLREKLPSLAAAIMTVKQFGYKLAEASTP